MAERLSGNPWVGRDWPGQPWLEEGVAKTKSLRLLPGSPFTGWFTNRPVLLKRKPSPPTMNPFAQFPCALAPLAAAAFSMQAGAAPTVTIQKVALYGERPPGTATGVTYSDFSDTPTMSDDGRIGYQATLLTGGTVTSANNTGIWEGPPAAVQLVAREGDPAPGCNGALFSSVSSPWVDPTGRSTFRGNISGSGVTSGQNDTGIWNGTPGSLALVMRQKDPANGVAGDAIYASLSQFHVARSGLVAFGATLSGTNIDTSYSPSNNAAGIWTRGAGAAAGLVLRNGQQAPGTGTVFTGMFLQGIGASDSLSVGGTLFNTTPNLHDSATFLGPAGGLQLIARENDPAPGCPSNWISRGLGALQRNDAGAFYAASSAVVAGNTSDVRPLLYYSTGGSSLTLIAKQGDLVPGTSAEISDLVPLGTNNQGTGMGLVRALASPGTDTFLCRITPTGIVPLVREGAQAPGLLTGVLFGELISSRYAMNRKGDLVFLNTLTGTGITGTNANSLWHLSAAGELTLLVRRETPLQIAPGDTRTPRGIFASSNPGSNAWKPQALNDNGQLAVNLTFTDNTNGMFVFTISAAAPADSLLIKTITRTPGAITFTTTGPSGQAIGVQYSESLPGNPWMDVGNVTVSGTTGTFTDTNATRLAKTTGFYRAFLR